MSALGTTLAGCTRQLQVQFGWLPGEAREVRVLHGEAKRRRLVHELGEKTLTRNCKQLWISEEEAKASSF